MKTEVYSWRVSAMKKAALISEARREGKTVSRLLDEITAEWLRRRRNGRDYDEVEQAAIRKRAASAIGSIRGGDPLLSSQVSQRIKDSLTKRYGR